MNLSDWMRLLFLAYLTDLQYPVRVSMDTECLWTWGTLMAQTVPARRVVVWNMN